MLAVGVIIRERCARETCRPNPESSHRATSGAGVFLNSRR
jgi:hypothetical protein